MARIDKEERRRLIDASSSILSATHHLRYAARLIKHPVISVLADEVREKVCKLDDLICRELRGE